MLSFVEQYAKNYFASQNGEEGLLLELLRRIGRTHGHAVEMGGHDGLYCSNTALLLREHGWSGLFVESDYNLHLQCVHNYKSFPQVRSQCSFVTPANLGAFVDNRCGLLSLDTDGWDYKLFEALRAMPLIVIVEIDSSIPVGSRLVNSDGGVGYTQMVELALEKRYMVVAHTGNLVLLDVQYAEFLPEFKHVHPLRDADLFFNRSWLTK